MYDGPETRTYFNGAVFYRRVARSRSFRSEFVWAQQGTQDYRYSRKVAARFTL